MRNKVTRRKIKAAENNGRKIAIFIRMEKSREINFFSFYTCACILDDGGGFVFHHLSFFLLQPQFLAICVKEKGKMFVIICCMVESTEIVSCLPINNKCVSVSGYTKREREMGKWENMKFDLIFSVI
jgi:hypothetical protein